MLEIPTLADARSVQFAMPFINITEEETEPEEDDTLSEDLFYGGDNGRKSPFPRSMTTTSGYVSGDPGEVFTPDLYTPDIRSASDMAHMMSELESILRTGISKVESCVEIV